jgi:hypothetical protein
MNHGARGYDNTSCTCHSLPPNQIGHSTIASIHPRIPIEHHRPVSTTRPSLILIVPVHVLQSTLTVDLLYSLSYTPVRSEIAQLLRIA